MTAADPHALRGLCSGNDVHRLCNKLEVNDHPSVIYGNRVSRMLFDQYLALEGSFVK